MWKLLLLKHTKTHFGTITHETIGVKDKTRRIRHET